MFKESQLGIKTNFKPLENNNTSKSFFDDDGNYHILEKGSIKTTIWEDTDRETPITHIKREYSSFDNTYNHMEEIQVSTKVFKEKKSSILTNIDLNVRIKVLKDEINNYSQKEQYEICNEIKNELDELEKLRDKCNG